MSKLVARINTQAQEQKALTKAGYVIDSKGLSQSHAVVTNAIAYGNDAVINGTLHRINGAINHTAAVAAFKSTIKPAAGHRSKPVSKLAKAKSDANVLSQAELRQLMAYCKTLLK
jgi:hypothetical protein